MKIPYAQPYLPTRAVLDEYIDGIYERRWLTNNGQLVQTLTKRLQEYLGVEHMLLVTNGTLALQIAFAALGVKNEAITTPFTFIATGSALQWQNIQPVFADIDAKSLCLSPDSIVAKITEKTSAIVPVHVFGNACDVEAIEKIAVKHKLKIIYDASHAFAVKLRGRSILNYGDASTLSFHATKLFHTIEGGAIIFKNKQDLENAKKMINFGITGPEQIEGLGINAKMNEFQAAMGLANLDEIEKNLAGRKAVWQLYQRELESKVEMPIWMEGLSHNYSYFPVLLKDEKALIIVQKKLSEHGVQARRYFSPSLDTLEFLAGELDCKVSQDIAGRVLCLPVYNGLDNNLMKKILKDL